MDLRSTEITTRPTRDGFIASAGGLALVERPAIEEAEAAARAYLRTGSFGFEQVSDTRPTTTLFF